MLKIPNVGELALLDMLTSLWGDSLVLHLYKNDYTPADDSVIGNFTEANFTGYTPRPLENWAAAVTVGGKARVEADPVTFEVGVVGTGNSIYGYYVTDDSGNLLWAERDANAPIPANVQGNKYTVLARFTFTSEA